MTHASDEQANFWHRAQFSYNELGQFTEINRFVGDDTTPIAVADTEFAYDDLNRLLSIAHTTGATTWAGYDYTYDVASRITSMDSYLDGLSEYQYDDTNQLTAADHTGSTDEAYEYDANGNRVMTGYSTGDNNQLLSDGTDNYTYDAEGNRDTRTVIATGFVTQYLWDHRDRLIGVHEYDDEANLLSTVTNTYDAFNRWIRREVDADGPGGSNPVDTFFVWDRLQLALEFTDNDGAPIDGDDLSHVYTNGPAVDQLMADFANNGDLNFALTDHLGTPRDFVAYDDIGEETVDTGHRIYDSFGNNTFTTGFSSFIGYTGRPFEITIGLGYNLNRWYDPAVGRWVSEDPIGFRGAQTSLASYVGNSPLQRVDPFGLKSKDYWIQKALHEAGITQAQFDGYDHYSQNNREVMKKIYAYYEAMFAASSTRFLWAGMAKLAGNAVWIGLQKCKLAIAALPSHGSTQAQKVADLLIIMNREIFLDLAWQHEAYLTDGFEEMKELLKQGDITQEEYDAWEMIDQGHKTNNPALIEKGNAALRLREQKVILRNGYALLGKWRLGTVMAALGDSPIPSGKPMSQVVPKGDLCNFADRWKWINTDMLPAWLKLPDSDKKIIVRAPLGTSVPDLQILLDRHHAVRK